MKYLKPLIIAIIFLIIGILIGRVFFANKDSDQNNNLHEEIEEVISHWTCSMHPQIDLVDQTPCPICGMDLIPKDSDSEGSTDPNRFKMSKTAIELANIQTYTFGKSHSKSKKSKLLISGKIKENENNIYVQTAHIGGRIEKQFYKSVGGYIKKGSIIIKIYSPELVTAQNELIQALEVKESQPELYNSVRKKLLNWKLTDKQIQEIEQTKGVINSFNIFADASGIITKKYIEQGDYVKLGDKLYEILNMNTIWAEFDVFERDISKIKKGNEINITLNAYPELKIKSKITFIDPLLDKATRTIKVRATIANHEYKLKPGMLINASINIKINSSNHEYLTIPKSAILWTGKRSIVYIKPDNTKSEFELRTIELGKDLGNYYEIISGINSGEEIVVNGTFTLDAAAQLQGKSSMMNPTADPGQKGIEMKCATGKCGGSMKGKDENIKSKSALQQPNKMKNEMKCAAGKCGG